MDEVSAYHEAGHALMAILLGARVASVSIDPDWDDGPARFAEAHIEWPAEFISEADRTKKFIQVALAGPVAEMIYSGDPFHPGLIPEWADDWRIAWHEAATLHRQELSRLRFLEQMTATLYQELHRDDNWAALAAIVDSLLAHERLESEEVHEIVTQWLG